MNKNKPNIIYLFADQWRKQAVGYANEDQVHTPHIDEFSKESVVFNQAITCSPLCSPHRASLLTGKYPMSTGVYTNCKIGAEVMLQPDEICISDVLKENGYATGYIGKWHLDLPELNVTEHPRSGAKNWDAYTPPGPKRHSFDYWYSYGAWDQHLHPHYWQDTPDKIPVDQWSVEHETDKAIEFMKKREKDQPFALFVSWNPPHSPFDQVPEKYKKQYEQQNLELRKNVQTDSYLVHTGEGVTGGKDELMEKQKDYFAAITGIDENFGRIMDLLDSEGLSENTIVVLTADHGEMMGSHGLMAKHVWFEESIGVPFCIRWPQALTPFQTDALLNTVDIMPTILQLADIEVPDTVEGTDLSPILLGQKEDDTDVAFICAYPGRKEAIEEFRVENKDNLESGWRGVRTKDYTYVLHKGYAPGESMQCLLYDLKNDPLQLNPESIKILENHSIANKLNQKLIKWLEKTGDPFINNVTENGWQ